jgi:DNA-binding protein H-NS
MAQLNLRNMDVDSLLQLRADIDDQLAQRLTRLQQQLGLLDGAKARKPRGVAKNGRRGARKGRRVAPQFRSKRNPKLTWAGRGAMPRWMREEMKGTKLKKENFRITA